MGILLSILIFLIFLTIAIQDFRSKLVSWFFFPLAFLLVAAYNFLHTDLNILLTSFFINAALILFLLLTLIAYFSLKNKKLLNIFNEHIGSGDILLFLVLAAAFSPFNFLLFMISSLLLTLILLTLRLAFNKNITRAVPLAGLFSIYFILVFASALIFHKPEMFNDAPVSNYLTKLIS